MGRTGTAGILGREGSGQVKLEWFRENGVWHLWRGYQADDGAVIWQETGYVVHRDRRAIWIEWPGKRTWTCSLFSVKAAKAEAENLAQNSL